MSRKSLVPINESSIVTLTQHSSTSELDQELIILNLQSEAYFGLDGIGAAIWKLLEHPKTVASIYQALLQEYDLEAADGWADLLTFLQELAAATLIEVRNESC